MFPAAESSGAGPRHRFLVIIPVADRPQHLGNILASLFELLGTFGYGGTDGGRFRKVAVVVADDSADPEAMRRHREIAAECDARGLPATYFGAEEQAQLLDAVPEALRAGLATIVGRPEADGFRHKGASVTRNLASLLAQRVGSTVDDCLFMFVDSDEQFKVRIAGADGEVETVAIDYFGCLDRIFSTGKVDVLTGKVVGDPPVSPAVMAGTLLADIGRLLAHLAAVDPAAACGCHGEAAPGADDASYHDMADLFGFAVPAAAGYRCPVAGPHDHAACLADLAARLDRFFDGEHPTRSSVFAPGTDCVATEPARTVYTGNYVCTPAGLAHFIPFAPLKLRMAGPVLGRLIRAAIGERFVSARLPLLHTRTDGGDAGYRAGVARQEDRVDLSGEFERQYFGDVMLFAIESLVRQGYPAALLPQADIERVVAATEAALHEKYAASRAAVLARLGTTQALFDGAAAWWNHTPALARSREDFHRFFANIRRNFDEISAAATRLGDPAVRASRCAELAAALGHLAEDRQVWAATLAALNTGR